MFSTSCLRIVTENSVPAPINTSASSAPAVFAWRHTSAAISRRSWVSGPGSGVLGLGSRVIIATDSGPKTLDPGPSLLGAADGDAGYQHGGHAHADRHRLAV